ncbi:Uncharacterized protein SCF082_LOCUS44619 [Durusdinium trenchii]|uniref:Uncharacterized protein n=1 Tax=Durusdinium trenchii TaxID=1381693 RepID=A0ABP0R411_9DINO
MYPKDYDKSLMTEDITRCQPTYDHLKYLEKPDMSVGCTDPVHPGGKARSYYAPMDRRPRDLSLTTADIELAIPRGGQHKGFRLDSPALGLRDIEYSAPNYAKGTDGSYGKTCVKQSCPAEKLKALNARPRWVPSSGNDSEKEKLLGIQLPSLQVREVGPVLGSTSKRLHWDNGEPQLSLLREDIAGTVPQRWVGGVPANIYDPPEIRPMMSFHDPHDIPGAQVGSLKKGIEGSRRRVNPLNPKYPMLDGNARPQPVPTFEAQRHPMLRNPSSTSSMHGPSRN